MIEWTLGELATLVTGVIGGGGISGYVANKVATKRAEAETTLILENARAAAALAAANQPVVHWQSLADRLEKQADRAASEHKECTQNLLKITGEVGSLKGKVELMTDLLKINFPSKDIGTSGSQTQSPSPTLLTGEPEIQPQDVSFLDTKQFDLDRKKEQHGEGDS